MHVCGVMCYSTAIFCNSEAICLSKLNLLTQLLQHITKGLAGNAPKHVKGDQAVHSLDLTCTSSSLCIHGLCSEQRQFDNDSAATQCQAKVCNAESLLALQSQQSFVTPCRRCRMHTVFLLVAEFHSRGRSPPLSPSAAAAKHQTRF